MLGLGMLEDKVSEYSGIASTESLGITFKHVQENLDKICLDSFLKWGLLLKERICSL